MAKSPASKTGGGGGASPRPTDDPTDDMAAELKDVLKRAGHDVPADRLPSMAGGYKELKIMLELLRQPRTAANEPANVYSLDTITRSI